MNLVFHYQLCLVKSSLNGEDGLLLVLDLSEFTLLWSVASTACSSDQVYLYLPLTAGRQQCGLQRLISPIINIIQKSNYSLHKCYTPGLVMSVLSTPC